MGDAGRVLAALIAAWKADPTPPETAAITAWWRQIDVWRGQNCLKFTQDMRPAR